MAMPASRHRDIRTAGRDSRGAWRWRSLPSATTPNEVGPGFRFVTGGARGGRAESVGERAAPYDAAPPKEEVAAAASRAPDGGLKRDGAAEVAYGPPARLVVGDQAPARSGANPRIRA